MSTEPHPAAVQFWDGWLLACAFATGTYVAGWRFDHAVALIAGQGIIAVLMMLFLVYELWAAFKLPAGTLSWRVWRFPTWARYACAAWLGPMAGVAAATSPLWPDEWERVPVVVGCLVFVGVAGWLAGHFPSRGEVV